MPLVYYVLFAGDFGNVVSIGTNRLEEGDCRYLPRELLNDDYQHLPKADIFALGLSMYQAVSYYCLISCVFSISLLCFVLL